jgi:hypothetical protein
MGLDHASADTAKRATSFLNKAQLNQTCNQNALNIPTINGSQRSESCQTDLAAAIADYSVRHALAIRIADTFYGSGDSRLVKQAGRIRECGAALNAYEFSNDDRSGSGIYLSSARACGVRLCPVCGGRSQRTARHYLRCIPDLIDDAADLVFTHVTLTLNHPGELACVPVEELGDEMAGLTHGGIPPLAGWSLRGSIRVRKRDQ